MGKGFKSGVYVIPDAGIPDKIAKKIEIVKLWENASPSSDFAAQTIALDLAGYDFVIMSANFSASSEVGKGGYHALAAVGGSGRFYVIGNISTNTEMRMYNRQAIVTETGVEFGDTISHKFDEASYTTANNYAIPLVIYGIKGVIKE